MLNKLLQRQLQKHFGNTAKMPENITKLLNVISESYDHYEKDRKLMERSSELSSKELTELNNQLKISGKAELEKVHTQLKMLFENIEEVFYSVDIVRLSIVQISAACEKVYGYTQEEFLGDPDLWKKVIIPEDLDIVYNHIKELYNGNQVVGHYRILHKDKSIRWLESKIIPAMDEAGQLVRLDGVTNDISERKRAEKELEESVSVLEATLESTADGILVENLKGKVVRFNKKLIELWRIPEDIVKSRDEKKAIAFVLDQLVNPDEFLSKVKELFVLKGSTSFDILKFKDGRVFERHSQSQLINNEFVGRVWSFRDITERKRAEKELEESVSLLEATLDKVKESEWRYRSLIEDANDAICITDASLKFYDMNPSGCRMLGYSKEEFLNLSVADLFFTEDLEANPFKIEDLKQGKAIRSDRRFKRKDGVVIVVDLSGKLTSDGRFIMFGRDISERMQAEKLIKESELRYRSLIEQATDAICIADKSMKFIDVNPSGCALLGYTKEEFLQLSVTDILTTEEIKTNPLKIEELALGKTVRNERKASRKDGTVLELEVSGKILDDGRFIVFARDISERKRAEKLIKESELRYRSLIEQATDAICIADASLKFIDINPYACEILGYTKEEALQLFIIDILFPEDLVTNPINKFDTIKVNEIIRNERRFKRKDGSSVTMEVSTRLIEDGRFILFGHDISERKKAESVVKENEGQLSVAAQIAKLGYWEFDVASNRFTFNDQFYSIFKTTAEEMGGYTMSSEGYAQFFVHPEDVAMVVKEAGNAIRSPDPHYSRQIEHRVRYANGEIGHMAARFFIVKDDQGRTIKTFGANQDVTESKKREATLLRSEASLDLMNKELGLKNTELEHFAYVASHDLQEPLRTTTSFVDLLQKQYKGKLDERADKYLQYITDSSDRMKVLITDLLDYSRIGNKKELQQVDCNKIMDEVLQDLGIALKETNAEISVDSLPVISGYQTEIKQLFQNLLVNAIKFRKKEIVPRVTISASKDTDCWTFTVRDNGIGIEKEHSDRIFIIFQRLHTRTEYEGSGIGLAHCKKIVGLHGGDIWVESVPGEGATFHFNIPLMNN